MALYWNVDDNPAKPWGRFDPNAVLDIPFDWRPWLAGVDEAIVTYAVTAEAPLEVVSHAEVGGLITPFIRVAAAGTAVLNQKYWVKCHVTTTGAVTPRQDDRTVYLRMVER